jgi:hypothetical protein
MAMSVIISIAGIALRIRGSYLFKGMTPAEKKILRPFIVHENVTEGSKKLFTVSVKKILSRRAGREGKGGPFDPVLVDKLRPHLCSSVSNDSTEKNFKAYLKRTFHAGPEQLRKFVKVLTSVGEPSSLVACGDLFLVMNKESRKIVCVFLSQKRRVRRAWSSFSVLFRMAIAEESGVCLHASSVEENGSGYVFVGRSGAGKSTTARMGKFDRILSDDITLIRKMGRLYSVFSNPWWNIGADINIKRSQVPVPLKAIFFIKKAKRTRMRKTTFRESLAGLMFSDGVLRKGLESKKKYLFFLGLLRDIPTFELGIKKGPGFEREFRSLARSIGN